MMPQRRTEVAAVVGVKGNQLSGGFVEESAFYLERPAWQQLAACRGNLRFLELCYPDKADGDRQCKPAPLAELEAICGVCEVRAECHNWAVEHEEFGYWAATSPQTRRLERSARKISLKEPGLDDSKERMGAGKTNQDDHGTPGGYQRHRRQQTPICDPCRIAANAAHAEQEANRRERQRAISV